MKVLLTIPALLNGGYMLADGIHVLLKGKYIGPEKPGPWVWLFEKFHINPFSLGPVFIVWGIVWLVFIAGLWTNQPWTFRMGLLIAVFTLWYLPVGTVLSLIVIAILLSGKHKLGLQ